MSNVLSEEKKQHVIALGKLGWPLRRIEQATGVRRETASTYLKAAGVVVRLPGWRRRVPAKPAMQVTTDSGGSSSGRPRATHSSRSARQRLRSLSRANRVGTASWPECHGHLAGLNFRSRFCRELSDGEAIRSEAYPAIKSMGKKPISAWSLSWKTE